METLITTLRKQIQEAKSRNEDTSYLEQCLEQAKESFYVAEFDDGAMDNTTGEELAYL
jgi:hypothetical protein